MRVRTRFALAIVAAVPLVAAAAGAAPTIQITSPAAGATISRSAEPTFTVTGVAAFDEAAPAERTFYLRRDACGGTDPAHLHLSTKAGSESGGCGSQTSPLLAVSYVYPAENGVPLTLAPGGDVTGQITLSSREPSLGGLGAGRVDVAVTLTGMVDGGLQQLATATETYTVVPGTPVYETPFTAPLAASVAGKHVESLSLEVRISGVGAAHGYVRLAGASFATLSILDAGSVEVAADSATFSALRTVSAIVAPDGSWTAEVNTPAREHGRSTHERCSWAPPPTRSRSRSPSSRSGDCSVRSSAGRR